MHRKVLYIGMRVVGQPKTGGEIGQLRNRNMLKSLYDDVCVIEIPRISILKHIFNLVLGRSYGYTRKLWLEIKEHLEEGFDFVFIDASGYGSLVRSISLRNNKVVAFCHNVEFDFYKDKYLSKKSFMNWALVRYMYKQERLTMNYATRIVVLNDRDNKGVKKYYNRSADLVLPVFYDTIDKSVLIGTIPRSNYLLFVGANFYANNDGIIWFIENVSPYISMELYIAGGCCEHVKKTLAVSKYTNVKLLGFVDDLDRLYKEASGVICPIFSGSGMKTKTVEAIRYGKSVFGTSEAFEGINADYSKIGGLCNTADDFIKAINEKQLTSFNDYSYDVFMNNFTIESNARIFNVMVEGMIS